MPFSPTSWPGGGGSYTPPTTQGSWEGNPVTINNGLTDHLTWDFDDGPDALLNIAVPAAPTIVAAGIYAFSVRVVPTANMTAGGTFTLALELAAASSLLTTSSPASAAQPRPSLGMSLTRYLAAGAQVLTTVTNLDGAASRPFVLFIAYAQRIT